MINLLLLVYCETFFVIINVDKKIHAQRHASQKIGIDLSK